MAINWGTALGAAVETGFKTYERLGEEEYREMMRAKMRKEMEQEKQFESAMANARKVDYTGGEGVADTVSKGLNFSPEQQAEFNSGLSQLPPDKQAEVLRAYSKSENATGAIDLSKIGVYKGQDGGYMASNETTPRRSSDIYRDVAGEMQAAGNTTGLMKAIGIKTAVRESDLQDKFDDWSSSLRDRMTKLQTTINNNGLSGVPSVVNPELKKAGITTEFVQGANGGSIVAKKSGKVVGTFGSGDDVLGAVMNLSLEGLASELLPMMGSPQAVASFIQGQQQIALKGREVDIKDREVGIKAGDAKSSAEYRARSLKLQQDGTTAPYGEDAEGRVVFQNNRGPGFKYGDGTTVPSDAKVRATSTITAGTRADATSMDARATDIATALFRSEEINPRTNKPFTSMEEAKTHAYKLLLKDGSAKQMTRSEEMALDAFLKAIPSLGENPSDAELIKLAKRYNLPSSITRLPEMPGTQTAISQQEPTSFVQSILNFGKKPAQSSAIPPKPAAPAYTPPPNSPAARALGNREQVVQSNADQAAARTEATKQADAQVMQALPAMSLQEAVELQRSPQFNILSPQVKAAVQRKVMGR